MHTQSSVQVLSTLTITDNSNEKEVNMVDELHTLVAETPGSHVKTSLF
jgi:hypothetical protein